MSRVSRTSLPLLCVLAGCSGPPSDLSTQQLSLAVDAQRPSLQRCYDAALKARQYKREVRMNAVIHVAPSGRVQDVELEGGGDLPGMPDCVRKSIRQWRFPKAKDPTDTSLPIVFQPKVVHPGVPDYETFRKAIGEAVKPTK